MTMEQTSRLSIVVDTATAKKQILDFSKTLKAADESAVKFNTALDGLFKASTVTKTTKAVGSIGSAVRGLQEDLGKTVQYMNGFSGSAHKFASALSQITTGATGTKAAASSIGSLATQIGKLSAHTAEMNNLSTGLSRVSHGLTALTAATAGTSGAAAAIATLTPRLRAAGAAATSTTAQNNQLLNSYTRVNTGLRTNAQFLAQTTSATTKHTAESAKAQLLQDKIAISAAKVAQAQTRAKIATQQLATVTSLAATAVTNLATAEQRLLAATTNRSNAGVRAVNTQLAQRTATARLAAANSAAAAAADRASTAALRLASAQARAAADAARLAGGLNSANASANTLTRTMTRLRSIMVSGVGFLAGMSVLKTADEMQNLDSQVKLVTQSYEEFLDVRARLREVADKNYTDISATTNLYQKSARALANLGKSQADAMVFTDAVSLAMRTGGRSANEQASAILQLGQAMGAGVVMGDEFRSISENAPILLELVAKKLGVLPGQLKEMSREGKITAEVMFDALSENIGMLEDMAKKMPITMTQAFNVAKNQYKNYVGDFMNKTDGMSANIAKGIILVSQNMEKIIKVVTLAGGLAFLQFASKINVAAKAMAVLNAVMLLNPFVLVTAAVVGLGVALYGVNDVFDTVAVVFEDFMYTMRVGYESLGGFVTAIYDVMREDTADGLSRMRQSHVGYFDDTVKGFAGMLQGISRVLAAALSTLASSMQITFIAFSNFGTRVRNIIVGVGNFTREIFNSMWIDVQDGINGVIGWVNQMAGGINSVLDRTPLTWRVGVVGTLKVDRSAAGKKAYKDLNTTTYGDLQGQNLGTLMPLVDNRFTALERAVGQRGEGRLDKPLSTKEMSADKARQKSLLDLANAQAALAEAAEKAARADKKKKPDSNQIMVYKAWKNAGLSDNQARIITAEVGREGSYLDKNLFGGHIDDSNKKYNLGMISWQKDRGEDLAKFLKSMGLIKGGKIEKSQKSLDAQAQFAVKEMMTNDRFSRTKNKFLANPDIGYDEGTEVLGRNYIAWRYDDPAYKEGHKNRDHFYNKLNLELGNKDASKDLMAEFKAQDDAIKEQTKIREGLVREFESVPERIHREHMERLQKVRDANYGQEEGQALFDKADALADREYAIYQNHLDSKLDALGRFQQSATEILRAEVDAKLFEIAIDEDLNLKGNEEKLAQAIKYVGEEYQEKLDKYHELMRQQEQALGQFRKTERQLLEESLDNEIRESLSARGVLSKRITEDLIAKKDYELELFDVTQEQKILEIEKVHLTELQYIQERYDIETRLNDLSNASLDERRAKQEALNKERADAIGENRKKAEGPYAEVMDRMNFGHSNGAGILSLKERKEEDLKTLKAALEAELITREEHAKRVEMLEIEHTGAMRDLKVAEYHGMVTTTAEMFKNMFGEQSKAYKAMFIVEKGFAIARSLMAIHTGIAMASALPFPANIGAMLSVAAATGTIVATLKGIAMPQLSGQAHDGLANVPREGTYLLDAGERVVKPRDNQKLTKFLDGEQSGGTNGRSDVKVFVTNMTDSQVVTTRNNDGDLELKIMKAINQHVPAQLANPSSPIGKSLSGNWQTAPRR